MRCHQHCGGAADFVHRQSSGVQVVFGRWWFLFYEGPVCVFLKRVTPAVIATILKLIAG